ncbi:hypothetical protein GCM10020331_029380 [Ectobacillus funiculus]
MGFPFSELIERLMNYESTYPSTVVTWGNMDVKVLKQNCGLANISYPLKGKHRDLSLEYKRFFGDRNQTGLWKAIESYGKKRDG